MSSPQQSNTPAPHLMDTRNVGWCPPSQANAAAIEASFRRTPPKNPPPKRPRTVAAPMGWITASEAMAYLENAPAASPQLSPDLSPELYPTQHSSSSGASPDAPELNASAEQGLSAGLSATDSTQGQQLAISSGTSPGPPELNASAEPGLSAGLSPQGQQLAISSDSPAGPPEARHIAVVQGAQLLFSAPPPAATSTAAPTGLGPGVTAETNQAAAVIASYGSWAISRKPFDLNTDPTPVLVIEWPTAAARQLREFAIVMALQPGQDCCDDGVLRASMRFVHKANLTPCPAPCWVEQPLKFKSKAARAKWVEKVKQAWAAALGNISPVVGHLSFKDYLLKYRPGTSSNALYGTNLILDHLISAREVDPSSSSTPRKQQQDSSRHKLDAAHKETIQNAYEELLPADPSPEQCAVAMASARHNAEAGTSRATSRTASTARNGLRSESKPLPQTLCGVRPSCHLLCPMCSQCPPSKWVASTLSVRSSRPSEATQPKRGQ